MCSPHPLSPLLTPLPLHQAAKLSDEQVAPSCIAMLRIYTGATMLADPDAWSWIAPPASTLAQFVTTEVNPLGVEADHVHIAALAQATAVTVVVVYLDRGRSDRVNEEVQGPAPDAKEGSGVQAKLLYRPGHYDVLYQ